MAGVGVVMVLVVWAVSMVLVVLSWCVVGMVTDGMGMEGANTHVFSR